MKNILSLILFLSISIQVVQSQEMDSLGINDSPELNKFESAYFNNLFKDERGGFSFNNAKVIFVTGNSGNRIVNKKVYFDSLVKPWLLKNSKPQSFYKILNNEEIIISEGYEVIILSWVKVFTKRKQKKIIRKMSKDS